MIIGAPVPPRPPSQQHTQTASVVEAVTTLALQSRLRSYKSVKTSVACDGLSLLQGRVNGVSVAGERWASPLGLTAERFDIILGPAALDVPAVAAGRILLKPPQPRGAARALFSASDFGRFLVHPLTAAAAASSGFAFDGASAAFLGGGDAIGFRCIWRRGRYALQLCGDVDAPPAPARSFAVPGAPAAAAAPPRGQVQYSSRVCVRAEPLGPETGEDAAAAALAATSFFNTLTIDLQGAELSYDGMALRPEGLVDLQLALLVRKFPPLDLKF
jgi:hypothetical protein